MKKYLSIWMLAARGSIVKMLGIYVAMAAAQLILFHRALQEAMGQLTSRVADTEMMIQAGELPSRIDSYTFIASLEEVIANSHMQMVWNVAFFLLTGALIWNGCQKSGSRLSYTIRRLSLTERNVVAMWGVYNGVCYLIFWGVQLLIALGLCQLYISRVDPEFVSEQTLFLAAYRSPILHSLLPLEEGSRYVRNLLMFSGLGISTACMAFWQRRGKKSITAIVLAGIVWLTFPQNIGEFSLDLFLSGLSIVLATVMLWRVFGECARGVDA